MPDKIKFGDVGSDYEPSESDGDYSEGEKELLKSIRRRGRNKNDDDEREEAVLAFDDEDDDDDDNDDDEEPDFDDIRKFEHDSDIEEAGEEDDLPDRFAWGSKASAFYGTGYTDRDYDTLTAQEEELAQLEEAEALEIQKRLIQGMTAEDFQLDLLAPTEAESDQTEGKSKKRKEKDRKERDEIVIKGDLSDLSERQQRELFRKDAPEFEGLVNDFSTKMNACMEMEPVLELLKQHNKLKHPFGQLLTKRYELSLLYCNNINFYVLLKAQKVPIRNHPLVKRLLQLKRLVQEVEQKYEQSIKPQVEQLLAAVEDGGDITFQEDAKRPSAHGGKAKGKGSRLKALARLEDQDGSAPSQSDDDDEDDGGFDEESETEETSAKRIKLGANEDDESDDDDREGLEERGENDNMEEDEEEEEDGDEKRKITYQMAKNRGLTARKRKDQRNVRVKNKQKYRKALIRRKGAVRPVRTELKRYAGETSIKAFVKRGIKIK